MCRTCWIMPTLGTQHRSTRIRCSSERARAPRYAFGPFTDLVQERARQVQQADQTTGSRTSAAMISDILVSMDCPAGSLLATASLPVIPPFPTSYTVPFSRRRAVVRRLNMGHVAYIDHEPHVLGDLHIRLIILEHELYASMMWTLRGVGPARCLF